MRVKQKLYDNSSLRKLNQYIFFCIWFKWMYNSRNFATIDYKRKPLWQPFCFYYQLVISSFLYRVSICNIFLFHPRFLTGRSKVNKSASRHSLKFLLKDSFKVTMSFLGWILTKGYISFKVPKAVLFIFYQHVLFVR